MEIVDILSIPQTLTTVSGFHGKINAMAGILYNYVDSKSKTNSENTLPGLAELYKQHQC